MCNFNVTRAAAQYKLFDDHESSPGNITELILFALPHFYFICTHMYLSKWACCILTNPEASRLVCVSFYSALSSLIYCSIFFGPQIFLALFVAHEWQRLTLLHHTAASMHTIYRPLTKEDLLLFTCVELGVQIDGWMPIEMFRLCHGIFM